MSFHGLPCWFELATGDLEGARTFHEDVLGWRIGETRMPDCDYRLAGAGGVPVAGLMPLARQVVGAAYGILQPEPMEAAPESGAFDQSKEGHGNWVELMTPDPAAAFGFYADQFGWARSSLADMGEHGTYQVIARDGADIGGMVRQGRAPVPAWFPYFGINGLDEAAGRVAGAGGAVLHGPAEVPGGAFIAICADPQGAIFAMVGPEARAA